MKNYTITFKDGIKIDVSGDRGEVIKNAWLDGSKATPFEIDGNGYLIGDIKRMQQTFVRDEVADDRLLERAKQSCRGQRSIQTKISQLIIKNYGSEWPKAIQDKKLREDMRRTLRDVDENWCDHLADTCVCDKDYEPVAEETIMERLGL